MRIIILVRKVGCDIPKKSFSFHISKKELKKGDIEIDICRDGIGNMVDLMTYFILKEK